MPFNSGTTSSFISDNSAGVFNVFTVTVLVLLVFVLVAMAIISILFYRLWKRKKSDGNYAQPTTIPVPEQEPKAQSGNNAQPSWAFSPKPDVESVYGGHSTQKSQRKREQSPKEDVERLYEEPGENAQDVSNAQANSKLLPMFDVESVYKDGALNTQSERKAQKKGELSPISDVQGGYEEPSRYQSLDSLKRVPIDANYQRLIKCAIHQT
jgi:FtsZ-interacting cell division protein ZipA